MMNGVNLGRGVALLSLLVAGAGPAAAQEAVSRIEVAAPQGVTVSVYDSGLGMINEARRVALPSGESDLLIGNLPSRIVPASASYGAAARAAPFDLLEQYIQYDLSDRRALLRRMIGQPVVVQQAGTTHEGILLADALAPADDLPVRSRDGRNLWMIPVDAIDAVTFPFGRDLLAVEPRLVWRVRARQEGPQNFRLAYQTDGLSWRTTYEMMLASDAMQADFSARVQIDNTSGGRYENARVRLLLTEKGMTAPILPDDPEPQIIRPALRYQYGSREPSFERSIAALAPIEIYELPRTVTLENERPTFVQLVQANELPIRRFHVYDGVRLDRFQRNRRTDWNYGTEFHTIVQTHVEFENRENFGLGVNLPPGLCRLYQVRADGAIDLIGEEMLLPIPVGGTGHLRVGPARGLTGERERTGYVEVKPHHVYEETFQIRLTNTSDDPAEIRVVEHLYRWPEFEIIRADADYVQTQPQTIEFKVELKPGGRRSINYTVRYTW